ncbi:hypothetical protein BDV24DRAFT_130175 [Aspergillus arachidicola]|uniref:Uncharacterized protein n=1 Tax=Aspergillus arachidicola TaxID=656916 RepID=A0A5N6YDS7_9EURO|nr:hypothetical protein BDV24DRAFT_130175 [Aspergillus arachidicola]
MTSAYGDKLSYRRARDRIMQSIQSRRIAPYPRDTNTLGISRGGPFKVWTTAIEMTSGHLDAMHIRSSIISVLQTQ